MATGILFFEDDISNFAKGGSIDVSSNPALKEDAYDNSRITLWTTTGENNDATTSYTEREWGGSRTIQCFYIWKTNIETPVIKYFTNLPSKTYTTINSGNATIISKVKSINGVESGYWYVCLDTPVSADGLRIEGSATIIADQEKRISDIYTFEPIGQFEGFPVINPDFQNNQVVFKLENGLFFIIEKGEAFTCRLGFDSHASQDDIDIYRNIVKRKSPLYIWLCGSDEDQFKYNYEPFLFENIYKVGKIKNHKPGIKNNYFKLALVDSVNLVELP